MWDGAESYSARKGVRAVGIPREVAEAQGEVVSSFLRDDCSSTSPKRLNETRGVPRRRPALALNAPVRILHGHDEGRNHRRLHQFRRTLVTLDGPSGHYDIRNSGTPDAGLKVSVLPTVWLRASADSVVYFSAYTRRGSVRDYCTPTITL